MWSPIITLSYFLVILAQATSQFIAKHSSIFPTKSCLQLKIREVRQKMMAESNHENAAATPGGSNSTPSASAGAPSASASALSTSASSGTLGTSAPASSASVNVSNYLNNGNNVGLNNQNISSTVPNTSSHVLSGGGAFASGSYPLRATQGSAMAPLSTQRNPSTSSRTQSVTSRNPMMTSRTSATSQGPASNTRRGTSVSLRSSLRYSDTEGGTAQQYSWQFYRFYEYGWMNAIIEEESFKIVFGKRKQINASDGILFVWLFFGNELQ